MAAAATVSVADLVWAAKYRALGPGLQAERSLADTWDRVALALSAPETQRREQWRETFRALLHSGRFLPGGRIIAGAGTDRALTLFNCFVTGTMHDSIGGIFSTLTEAMLTLQAGGGVGCDFSLLRPRGMPAHNSGNTATGPVSFLHVWEAACETVAEGSLRRGAMMATMRCDHPDIARFIDAKRNPDKAHALRHFNLSVLVSDAFLQAVEEDGPWPLLFPLDGRPVPPGGAVAERFWSGALSPTPCLIARVVGARALWDHLCQAARECGDPGVMFIDRIAQMDNLHGDEAISATNPCGEVPLPPHGACNLGSINLARCVLHPFSPAARLDLAAIETTATLAVRLLDNVYACARFPLKAQEKVALAARRIGLGITGFADALAMLGVRYGSATSCEIADSIVRTLCHAAYRASIALAAERGSFPAFHAERFLESGFVRTLPDDVRRDIARHGIRNSHLVAIAPAGSISLLAGNVSSGIEPIHALHGHRRLKLGDGREHRVPVTDYAWALFREMHGEKAPLPDAFVEARDVNPFDQLALQATMQAHVDQAISKTLNLGEHADAAQVSALFLRAWKLGLKGCTAFVARAAQPGVLPHPSDEGGVP